MSSQESKEIDVKTEAIYGKMRKIMLDVLKKLYEMGIYDNIEIKDIELRIMRDSMWIEIVLGNKRVKLYSTIEEERQ